MSTFPKDIPGGAANPFAEAVEKDEAGNPVRELLQEQLGDDVKKDDE